MIKRKRVLFVCDRDSAGRSQIDSTMMNELTAIEKKVKVKETLLWWTL